MVVAPLRICRISSEFPPPWKGLAPGPYELSLAQVRRGHKLIVLTRERDDTAEFDRNLPFQVIRVPAIRDFFFSMRAGFIAWKLNEIHRFDVIHAHGLSGEGVLLFRRVFNFNLPVITTFHCVREVQRRRNDLAEIRPATDDRPSSMRLFWERFQENAVARYSDNLIAVSEGVHYDLCECVAGISHRIVTAGNGVDPNRFDHARKPPIDGPGGIQLLWVGRYTGFKGEKEVLAAADLLSKNALDFTLTMVGDGPGFLNTWRDKVSQPIARKTTFLQSVPYEQMPELYQNAHIFILPSYSEGMPKAALEAMACGCPVILSDIPGCRELVHEGKNGFLVPKERPDLLAKTITRFAKNPELIDKMGRASRFLIEQKYTWDIVAERIESSYREVLDEIYIK